MTLIRSLALRTLNAVVRRTRPGVREWGVAMLREMDFIENDWAAFFWAVGSVRSVISTQKGSDVMRGQQINRVSGKVVIVLSLIALFTVLSGFLQPPQRPEPDEGAAAHIFQLSIVALVPMIVLFLGTADWKRPLRVLARPLAFPAAALVLAFGALYYLEHYR